MVSTIKEFLPVGATVWQGKGTGVRPVPLIHREGREHQSSHYDEVNILSCH